MYDECVIRCTYVGAVKHAPGTFTLTEDFREGLLFAVAILKWKNMHIKFLTLLGIIITTDFELIWFV